MVDKMIASAALILVCAFASIPVTKSYYDDKVEKIPDVVKGIEASMFLISLLSLLILAFVKIWA